MKKLMRFFAAGTMALCMMLVFAVSANAYVDPSVMTYIIQAVAGIVIAVGAAVGIYWRKAKKKLNDKLGIDEKGNPIGFYGEGQFDFSNGQNVAGNITDKTLFFMQDKVNNFSGVLDYTI